MERTCGSILGGEGAGENEERGRHVDIFVGVKETRLQSSRQGVIDLGAPFISCFLSLYPAGENNERHRVFSRKHSRPGCEFLPHLRGQRCATREIEVVSRMDWICAAITALWDSSVTWHLP